MSTKQCHLCLKPKKSFHCIICIKNGDFTYSTSMVLKSSKLTDSFANKLTNLAEKQQAKNEIKDRLQTYIDDKKKYEDLVQGIRIRKEKNNMLQNLITEKMKQLERKKKIHEKLSAVNTKINDDLAKHNLCKKEVVKNINDLIQRQPDMYKQLDSLKPHLSSVVRQRINELVKFIFPITEVISNKSSITSDSQEDIKNKLAEASRTAYIRGRWIVMDSCAHVQHSIVGQPLPDSGDYSQYLQWVSVNKNNLTMACCTGLYNNSALSICVALAYVTQLVNLIAFYLDVRLPNILPYCEFSSSIYLSDRKFMNNVTLLNANILMLCLTYNVDQQQLSAPQTIRNLLLLLESIHRNLGKVNSSDISSSCISYLEEQLSTQARESTRKVSICEQDEEDPDIGRHPTLVTYDEDDEYDSDHFTNEWESVPLVQCPEVGPPPSTSVSRRLSNIQTSSIAGGLVTSVSTTINTFFRGWNTNK